MNRTILFLPLVAALVFPLGMSGAPVPKDAKADAVKADLEKLAGTWKVVSYQKDGEEMDPEDYGQVTFKDRTYTWSGDADGPSGVIDDLDPTQTPKQITYKGSEKDAAKEYGIYMLTGDVFVDCFTLNGEKERPTEFVSKKKSGAVLVVYKRVRKVD